MTFLALTAFGALAASACSTSLEGDAPNGGGDRPTGGATADEVTSCKASCDKMKFFDCSSAEEQARCYDDCASATSSQIEVFTGCAENSVCDPECRTTIVPKGEGEGRAGASASSCADACDKLVSCKFISAEAKATCESKCTSSGYSYQIDCVKSTPCGSIESSCGGVGAGDVDIEIGEVEENGVDACLDQCDSVSFFDCADATAFSACRKACSSAPDDVRDTFTACSASSGPRCDRKEACLDELLK